MAIFNSYVSLPEGTENIVKSPNDLVKPWKTLGEYDRYYLLLCFLYGLGALSTTNNHPIRACQGCLEGLNTLQ